MFFVGLVNSRMNRRPQHKNSTAE